jgi:hypothetical protein
MTIKRTTVAAEADDLMEVRTGIEDERHYV